MSKKFLKVLVTALLLSVNLTSHKAFAEASSIDNAKVTMNSEANTVLRGKPMKWFAGARNDEYTWYGLQDSKNQEMLEKLYQDYLDTRNGIGAQAFGKALPFNHELTVYVQKILDWGDESARLLYKKETGKELMAPHPIAKVIPSSSLFNAFASGAPICTDLQFGENVKTDIGVLLNPSNVMEVPLATSGGIRSCLPRPSSWTDAGILDFWQNTDQPPKCILKLENPPDSKGKLIVTDKSVCAGTQGWGDEPGAGGEEAIIGATSQFIHISTDIFARVADFKTLLYILAHELGHYYLGHNTDIGASRYNYIYSRDNLKYGVPNRNVALTKRKEYIREAYMHKQAESKNLYAPNVDPTRKEYSDRLNKFLILGVGAVLKQEATLPQEAATSGFHEKCSAVVAKLPPNYIIKKMTGGFIELVDSNLQDARAIFKQQLKKNEVAAEWVTGVLGENPISDHLNALNEYKKLLADCAPQFSLVSGKATVDSAKFYRLMRRNFLGHAPVSEPEYLLKNTLADFLGQADSEAKATDRFITGLLPAVSKNVGGFYTAEQAADEFALKIATMGGLTADEVLAGVLRFGQTTEGVYNDGFGPGTSEKVHRKNMDLSASECKQAYDDSKIPDNVNGFSIGGEGKFIGMGNLTDKHHSDCYRVFNLWRLTQIDSRVALANRGQIKNSRVLAKTPVEAILPVDKFRYTTQVKPLEDQFAKMLQLTIELSGEDAQ
jgi:hypothetical protein